MIQWIIIGAIVLLLLVIWGFYNSVVSLKNQVTNSWAQIDVQLKRRYDLIPNLMESVKGYMKHEKGVLESVTKARTQLMSATSVSEKAKANNMMTESLKSLFAVAENYPKLEASQNFIQLQEELSGTESKIAYARQHYNDVVMEFNTKIEQFPGNVFAKMFSFTKNDSFEASSTEKENVKVSF